MSAIELRDVTKRFGDVIAIDTLTLTVESGEIYGFLGPNGAGKTTTIDLLLDFSRPTAGTVEVLGFDARCESLRVRKRVGVLPEGVDVYDRLTGRHHLQFAAESKGVTSDAEALAERVGIADAIDRTAGGYSKGMAQRLMLGTALVGEPELLILDEPSTGLDPGGAREMRDIVREERERGATVFFSSHSLEQVDAVCDRVGILRDGTLVAEDTVEGLRDTAGSEAVLTVAVDRVPEDALPVVRALSGVSEASAEGTSVTVHCRDDMKAAVLNDLETAGASIQGFELEEPSLEEVFMTYTSSETGTADAIAEQTEGQQ